MNINRREWLAGAAASLLLNLGATAQQTDAAQELPATSDEFPIVTTRTFLNSARWHPMSVSSVSAMQAYVDYVQTRSPKHRELMQTMEDGVKAQFAKLINADPLEIAYVQSTMMGENIVLAGIDALRSPGNIVTDVLHYQASIYLYRTLQRNGHDVRIVDEHDGRIEMKDLEAAIDKNTRLVSLSLVSFANGFQHDLKRVCEIAHAHRAHVYADIVQAVGAVPIDVRDSGIDFCACSTYKWLMGDMGIGFLYVRADLLGTVIHRTQYGKQQITDFENHIFPYDVPFGAPESWKPVPGAGGYFEVGSYSLAGIACLTQSLPYILKLGVDRIQAHARSLTSRLQQEMPKLGFSPLSPPDGAAHIVAFAVKDPERVRHALMARSIEVTFDQHRMRLSPSVFNDQKDIDHLLDALHGITT
jgi:selenocysteine lyase/cysteine desulfurase